MNANKIFILTFLSTLLVLSAYTPLENKDLKVDKIVIDAGHGGHDPGCHGKKSKEAKVSLDVALKLKDIIVVISIKVEHFRVLNFQVAKIFCHVTSYRSKHTEQR